MPTNADTAYFLKCDGRSLATTGTYAALFAAIGYQWGGSGANFNIPDFRSRVPVGAGTRVPVGENEGLIESQRDINHSHTYTSPGDPHGGYEVSGPNSGLVGVDRTSGNSFNQDQPAYLGVPIGIRFV
jgi:microcystin-dependent protein